MKKLIAILLLQQSIFFVSALDVVTLTNGTVIEGEITSKDTDGSLLINLPDGNKRYIMANEIASVATNDVPFNQAVMANKQKQESKHSLKVSVYAGYNQSFSASDKEIGQIIKPSPGFTIGAGISFYPDQNKRFFLNPAIELIGYWRNHDFNLLYKSENIDGRHYLLVMSQYDDYFEDYKFDLKVQIPLCIGVDLIRRNSASLSVLTGPIIAMDYLIKCGLVASWSYSTFEGVETWEHWNSWSQEYEEGESYPIYDSHEVGRWRVDWRFGVRFNHKHFMAGANFDLGIFHFPSYGDSNRNMLPNSAQIVVGYTF